ncbi:MAG: cytochrome c biogenesis protein CcsA [Deltaproteobacteria bacterium]|nr:cytochrome c biogenesis protein CcsA [Deltaproteobacteria bacterium]
MLALAAIGISLWMVFFNTPVENQMGIIQKIFYFHVPAAYVMYLSWATCTVASVMYIIKNTDKFDILARSSAEIALLFGIMVMTTGPLWGKKAWGAYWVWDPRLTSAMVLTLIILSYVILRHMSGGEVIKKFSAALSIAGAAMIPLIHISVKIWRGQHPSVLGSGGLAPEMRQTLIVCMTGFTIVFIVFLKKRYRLESLRRRGDELTRLYHINQMNKQ